MLKPNECQQNEALLAAMSEILWNIGEKMKVTVVLPGEVPLIAHSHTYFQDSVTEKVNCLLLAAQNESDQTVSCSHVPRSYSFSSWRNWKICKFSWRDICTSWVRPVHNLGKNLGKFNTNFLLYSVYWRSGCWGSAISVQCRDYKDTVKVVFDVSFNKWITRESTLFGFSGF